MTESRKRGKPIDWSNVADNELARRIAEAADQHGLRQVALKAEVARGALEHIMYGRLKGHPTLTTINRLAVYFNVPAWRIEEMAGFDVQLPNAGNRKAEADRLSQLLVARPELAPLADQIVDLTDEEIRAARAFLESLHHLRRPRGEPPSSTEGAG